MQTQLHNCPDVLSIWSWHLELGTWCCSVTPSRCCSMSVNEYMLTSHAGRWVWPRHPPALPSPIPTAPTAVAGLRSSPFPRAELSCRCLSCGSASAVPSGLSAEGSLSWAELDRLCAAAGTLSQSRSSLQGAVPGLKLAPVSQVASALRGTVPELTLALDHKLHCLQ